MPTIVPAWIGINAQQGNQAYVKTDFFPGFTHGGILDYFANVHKAAWNRPTKRRISPLNQNNRATGDISQFDNGIGG